MGLAAGAGGRGQPQQSCSSIVAPNCIASNCIPAGGLAPGGISPGFPRGSAVTCSRCHALSGKFRAGTFPTGRFRRVLLVRTLPPGAARPEGSLPRSPDVPLPWGTGVGRRLRNDPTGPGGVTRNRVLRSGPLATSPHHRLDHSSIDWYADWFARIRGISLVHDDETARVTFKNQQGLPINASRRVNFWHNSYLHSASRLNPRAPSVRGSIHFEDSPACRVDQTYSSPQF